MIRVPSKRKWPRLAGVAGFVLALAGCAGYSGQSLAPGATQAQTLALMGQPTGRHALPNGERLEYAKGPAGLETFMLDFDAQGGLVRREQVLDENHFAAIQPGMGSEQVRTLIGRPSHVQGILWNRTVWSWRFNNTFCTWFQATMETDGTVRDVGYGPDPRCEKTRFP